MSMQCHYHRDAVALQLEQLSEGIASMHESVKAKDALRPLIAKQVGVPSTLSAYLTGGVLTPVSHVASPDTISLPCLASQLYLRASECR